MGHPGTLTRVKEPTGETAARVAMCASSSARSKPSPRWSRDVAGEDIPRVSSVEGHTGVEHPGRVERGLDPPHQRDLGGILQLEEVPFLLGADPVFARDRAAEC